MRRHPVAGTYANALLDIGVERNEVEAYDEELSGLAELFASSREFRVFFENPKVPQGDKLNVLNKTLKGKVSEPVLNLLMVLVKRGRQELFGQVSAAYTEALDESRGRTKVTITTASPIDPSLKSELVGLVGKKLNREIVSTERVDENLLGGMTIRIGDTVIDGSVRTKLNRVREGVGALRIGSEQFDEN
ncbi:MAG: ATP synthase F1 subunit delta [Planctomycetota bacterium]